MLVTLHRPSNVDDPERLAQLLERAARRLPPRSRSSFPIHPRTRARLVERRRLRRSRARPGLHLVEPLGYLDFLGLMTGAAAVVTDSGGVQEETTVLGVPCVTVRTTTERPVTVTAGHEPAGRPL